jgi:hypothetical protein
MHTGSSEMQETLRGGDTTHPSGMNPGLISDQPQEAEGDTDLLPRPLVTTLTMVKLCLYGLASGMEVLGCVSV